MVSLFNALNITSNALHVNESAISVVSHNVANMNTEGYSKQKVNLATRNIAGAIGNNTEAQIRANGGVKIASVTRYSDSYLNNYYRDQLSLLKQYEEELGNIGDLANIFEDLEGKGISDALASFYDAVNNLNEYPASSTARVNFIESAKTLTATLNAKSSQLDELGSKALGDGESIEALQNSKIYNQYEVFNDKLEELAEINRALTITQTGSLEANNLLDKRDMVLNEIAEFVDINIDEKPNGSVDLYVGGVEMVSGSVVKGELRLYTAQQYVNTYDDVYVNYPDDWVVRDENGVPITDENGDTIPRENAVLSIVNPKDDTDILVQDANPLITSGSLGGMLHSGDLDADGINVGIAKDTLDNIAQALVDIFNGINTRKGAYCINPNETGKLQATTGDNFIFGEAKAIINPDDNTIIGYELKDKVTAGNIAVNSNLLTDNGHWSLACAYFDNPNDLDVPPNFDVNAIGNSQNVVSMLKARTHKFDGKDGMQNLNGMTIEDCYTGLLGKIGAGGSNGQALVDTQSSVVDSVYNQIKSRNSVDLNEELVDLVKYQTAYSAAAQVFNTCNTCLDTLIALGG